MYLTKKGRGALTTLGGATAAGLAGLFNSEVKAEKGEGEGLLPPPRTIWQKAEGLHT